MQKNTNIEDKLHLKPRHRDGKHQVPSSRGSQPKLKVSQWQKTILPPEAKANQTKRQTQRKKPTPPEEENTIFHQLS
jgi:hypothetical protein